MTAAQAASQDPLDAENLDKIRSEFSRLMELANRHDLHALHDMFWQSPSVLLVAKSAIPSEGNWAGFWGNDAVDQKLHDIAASGPVVLQPDLFEAEGRRADPRYCGILCPLNITVSYAGQDRKPKPFLLIINWIQGRGGLEGRFRDHPAGPAGHPLPKG